MTNFLLITCFIAIFSLAIVLVWVVLEQIKLRKNYIRLSDNVIGNNKDIAGLCSAAVFVDKRLSGNDEQLKEMGEKITDLDVNEQEASQSYFSAIQKVREGCSAEKLVQQCGISREEAELLIRLHG